ncbi:MAG: YceI family protein [Bacteroidia bacterium]|nr:YceI family protein [Bacteroidia bacterium]
MKHLIVAFCFILGASIVNAQSTVWKLDKSHSSVGFTIDHMVISEVTGSFNDFVFNVKSDKPDFTDAVFDATIQVKSIDTKEPKRDDHLRSDDFFDAANYPTIKFVGKKFSQVSGKQYKVTGDLTMHGVTKTVTLDAKFNGLIKDPYGNTRAGLKVWGEIDRYDYGLKYNAVLEAGGLTIGQTVRLNINAELIQAK